MSRRATILIVDDERLIRWSLAERLGEEGHRVLEAGDGATARQLASDADLILLDWRLPDVDGLELLKGFRRDGVEAPVLMMTGHATIERAVLAMKEGAWHYATKPLDLDEIAILVERALETSRLRRQVEVIRARESAPYSFDRIIGESPAMHEAKSLLAKIAATPASTILLTGESGTGKDLAAKAIHYHSARAENPYMNITCSAIQDTLLESELFGHERGAFTDAKRQKRGLLQVADGGTVFLDEIGETTPGVQAKLLRFLEDKTFRRVGGERDISVDVRIIAATNRDLAGEVTAGRFREDLYWRLRVLPIELPPLRARTGDVPLLVQFYLEEFARTLRKPVKGITNAAENALNAYRWRGNVRELKNAVERAVLLANGPLLDVRDFLLPRATTGDETLAATVVLPDGGCRLVDVERSLVVQALARTADNRSRAARMLGLTRDQIRYRIEKFGL